MSTSGLPGILCLAAGQSARFGSNKLLTPLTLEDREGREHNTVLGQVLSSLKMTGLPLHCVLPVKPALPLVQILDVAEVTFSMNNDCAHGMGSSLACGVSAKADWPGWVIALADMPFLRPETVRSMMETWDSLSDQARSTAIIIPVFTSGDVSLVAEVDEISGTKTHRGHPILFGKAYYPELCALSADQGGRAIIQAHADAVIEVPVADPGILADVDTPELLARWLRLLSPGSL